MSFHVKIMIVKGLCAVATAVLISLVDCHHLDWPCVAKAAGVGIVALRSFIDSSVSRIGPPEK